MFQKFKNLFKNKSLLVSTSWEILLSVPKITSIDKLGDQEQQIFYKQAAEALRMEVVQMAFDVILKAQETHILQNVDDNETFRLVRSSILGINMARKQLEQWAALQEPPKVEFDIHAIL